MSQHPLDHPAVLKMLFYPRRARPGDSRVPGTRDGDLPVADGIRIGWRFYAPRNMRAAIVYFHGNGEIASDHDDIAPLYFQIGAGLLVIDYRGYGWSTGSPLASTLLTDAEALVPALPDILQPAGASELPLVLMGRSLGSGSAVHLAHRFPDRFKALIVESGFADAASLLRRLGLPVDVSRIPGVPASNVQKIAEISLPLLVIHGENDKLLPVEHGQQLYDASPAPDKRIVRIKGAGHNDILYLGQKIYFNAIADLLDAPR